MVEMQRLYRLIDQLRREELEELNHYIQQRRLATVWAVPTEEIKAIEQLMRPTHEVTSTMTEEEINSVLDDALAEVRRERKTQGSY